MMDHVYVLVLSFLVFLYVCGTVKNLTVMNAFRNKLHVLN